MRAELEVHRDNEGRLVGELDAGDHEPRAFIGVLELVRLIEQELGEERFHSDAPSQSERGS